MSGQSSLFLRSVIIFCDSYRFVLIEQLFQSELSVVSSVASSTTGDAVIAFLRLGSGTFGSVYVRNDVRFI